MNKSKCWTIDADKLLTHLIKWQSYIPNIMPNDHLHPMLIYPMAISIYVQCWYTQWPFMFNADMLNEHLCSNIQCWYGWWPFTFNANMPDGYLCSMLIYQMTIYIRSWKSRWPFMSNADMPNDHLHSMLICLMTI